MAGSDLAINRAGTLVGSILESAGYIYQSSILDSIKGPFVDKVGGLVYLFAIVLIIFQVAIQKNAKAAAWLFIGPPLFFVVINSREPIENARWSFGSSDRDAAKTAQGVAEISNGGSKNVSKVFKMYTEMISATSASMVDTIIRQDRAAERKEDVWFLIKGELNAMLTSVREEDPNLLRLIQHALLGDCRAVVEAARGIDDPLRRFDAGKFGAVGEVLRAASEFFSPTRRAAQENYERLLNTKYVQLDPDSVKYIQNLKTTTVGGSLPDFTPTGNVASCSDIWSYVLKGVLAKSEVHRKNLVEKAEDLGIDENVMMTLWLEASGTDTGKPLVYENTKKSTLTAGAADVITRIIAKFYLRNEIRGRDAGSLIAEMVGKHDIRRLQTNMSGHMAYTEQARIASEEWSEKERLMYASSALPYYQGVALYFLGMTFPFFAFLLLFPGKMGGFLMWFMLWMWVKSWDIALAVVMQLDDILWALLAVQKSEMGVDERLPLDLQAAMVSLTEMDPTYQMTVYYTILAVCIIAIPPVTAQLILGGMKGGASIMSQGMARYSDFFSDAMLIGVQQGVTQRLSMDSKQLKQDYAHAYHKASEAGLVRHRPSSGGLDGVASINMGSQQHGQGAMPGLGVGSSHQARSHAGTSASQGIGKARGRAQGVSGYLGAGASGQSLPGLATRGAGLPKLLEGYIVNKDISRMGQERGLDVAEANWDANVSAAAYQIYERMALYGAIPVPWTALVNDFADNEMTRAKFEYKAEQGYSAEGINVLKDALSLGVDAASFAGDGYKKYQELVNQGDIGGAVNMLDSPQKEGLFKWLSDSKESIASAGVAASLIYATSGQSNNSSGTEIDTPRDLVPEILKNAFDNQDPFYDELRQRERDMREEEVFDMREISIGSATEPIPHATQAISGRRGFGRRINEDN